MKRELQILKSSMAVRYCGKTRFDFLDEDEIPLILKAMHEYAQEQVKKCTIPDVSKSVCDIEKGTKCDSPNIKYRTGVCRNCGGQATVC